MFINILQVWAQTNYQMIMFVVKNVIIGFLKAVCKLNKIQEPSKRGEGLM